MTSFMSAVTPRSTSLQIPSTQNTAPILDFRCLYTHDLRRKSKRWHDGIMRFHTFNKRIMVYDVSRNFIGDTHWRDTVEVGDGDELELEHGGAMVQVGEATGKTEQDISGLFEKKTRERADGRRGVTNGGPPIAHPPSSTSTGPSQPRPSWTATPRGPSLTPVRPHPPSYAPKGPYGRAMVSAISPFATVARLGAQTPTERLTERPTKRRKQEASPRRTPAARQDGPGSVAPVQRTSLQMGTSRRPTSEPIEIIEIPDDDGPTALSMPRAKRISSERSPLRKRPTALTTAPVERPIERIRAEDGHAKNPATKPLRIAPRSNRKKLLCQTGTRPVPPPLPPPPPSPPSPHSRLPPQPPLPSSSSQPGTKRDVHGDYDLDEDTQLPHDDDDDERYERHHPSRTRAESLIERDKVAAPPLKTQPTRHVAASFTEHRLSTSTSTSPTIPTRQRQRGGHSEKQAAVKEAPVLDTTSAARNETGPWSREAFDLFGAME